jgi:hypothetical protein
VRSRSLRRDYGTLSELIAVGGAGGGDFPSPVVPNPSWLQANWYVNPVTGNDSASGTSPATAVKTIVGGIVARWGTTAPTLAQNTTIFLLESETIDQEYVVLEPVLVGAVSFAIIGCNDARWIVDGRELRAWHPWYLHRRTRDQRGQPRHVRRPADRADRRQVHRHCLITTEAGHARPQ